MTENLKKCQKCGNPVAPGLKFCESCGAKIEASPACPKCGAELNLNAKFCESCGAPIGSSAPADAAKGSAPAASPAPETTPVEAARPPAEPAVKAEEPVKAKEKVVTVPGEKPAQPVKSVEKTAPAPAPVKEPKKPENVKEVPKETSPKKPVSPTTMIIGAIIVLALLGAAVFFVVLPMLSGSGAPALTQPASPAATSSGTPATSDGSSQAGGASLVAGPTDVLPNKFALIIDVEKNAISRDIIVTFQGGEGQYGVRDLVITVTRSDGTTETKLMKTPLERGDSITVKGTEKSDRVEITAKFHSGETYKVVDKVFEYKKRVGSS